jgi:outer membrane protein OmpA-like peptidoglycan-associated protein
MNRTFLSVVAAGVLLTFATACETVGKRTAIGGGVGAVAGAGLGALLGGKKGALIGAGVGALAGGSVGLYLDKQAKELEQVAKTKRTENGLVVEMASDILFDVNSADLKPAAVEQLIKVGDIIAKYSDDRVRIEGYTDSSGAAAYNQGLSTRRADSVKQVLMARGVKDTQITALGMGEAKPIADNATSEGRAKNRRVELHVDVPNPS